MSFANKCLYSTRAKKIRVFGKSLLYRVSLELSVKTTDEQIEFFLEGDFRLGPKSGSVSGHSCYLKSEGVSLLEVYDMQAPSFFWKDHWDSVLGEEFNPVDFVCPLGLLNFAIDLLGSEKTQEECLVFTSNKLRKIHLRKTSDHVGEIILNEKRKIICKKSGSLYDLELSNPKVSLKMEIA